jgi:hypothetical protein
LLPGKTRNPDPKQIHLLSIDLLFGSAVQKNFQMIPAQRLSITGCAAFGTSGEEGR